MSNETRLTGMVVIEFKSGTPIIQQFNLELNKTELQYIFGILQIELLDFAKPSEEHTRFVKAIMQKIIDISKYPS